jgi:hypothetical protein
MLAAKWCKQCGGSLPAARHAKQIYCSPECRKASQRERDGKTAPDAPRKTFEAAPGCLCGTCRECAAYRIYKRDSDIWHERQARAERRS